MSRAAAITNPAHEDKTLFGFWVYLMTDCVLFASLFATFAVLRNNTNGGPNSQEIFEPRFVLTETIILLTSSFLCGLALLAARQKRRQLSLTLFAFTALLGLAFVGMEIHEFSSLYHENSSWQHSAFLSSFFTLVGTHGLHITVGLIWMVIMMIRMSLKGITDHTLRKLTLLSMFWHFLDIVWIFIFTIVYMFGVAGI